MRFRQRIRTESSKNFRKRIAAVIIVAAAVAAIMIFCAVSASADFSAARTLPHTGGRGRIAIYASGGGILAGCTIYGITALRMRKRRQEDEDEDDDNED